MVYFQVSIFTNLTQKQFGLLFHNFPCLKFLLAFPGLPPRTPPNRTLPVKCLHISCGCAFPPRTQLSYWTWPFINSFAHPRRDCRHSHCHSVLETCCQTFPGSISGRDWEMPNCKPGWERPTWRWYSWGKRTKHQPLDFGEDNGLDGGTLLRFPNGIPRGLHVYGLNELQTLKQTT